MSFHSDFDLRKQYKILKKEKKLTEARELLMKRINHDFLEKSGYYDNYCAQTFTCYFYEEAIKLLIQLSENEAALNVYRNALKLPHLRRENEISFLLIIGNLYSDIPIKILPKFDTINIKREMIKSKGKQKFLGIDGSILFVEEIALEYYFEAEKLKGVWLNPSTEDLYFDIFQNTIGHQKYNKIMSMVQSHMGHICNRCYGVPDLLLYQQKKINFKNGKFVEVKGPKDCLSAAQYTWIEILKYFQLPFELLKVENSEG